MNFRHAVGFLIVGVALGQVPQWAPEWCPANAVDGSSARALWLQVMSSLQIAMAAWYFLRRAVASLASLAVYTPPVAADAAPERTPAPVFPAVRPAYAVRLPRPALARVRSRPVIPLPAAAFDAGTLLDQRAA